MHVGTEIDEKSMQFARKTSEAQKSHQKLDLGASRAPFWRLRSTFWTSFGRSGALFGCLLNAPGRLLDISWASWALLASFGMDLGAIWEPHGSIWGAFERLLYDILLIKGTPALPRYAPRSVTILFKQMGQFTAPLAL